MAAHKIFTVTIVSALLLVCSESVSDWALNVNLNILFVSLKAVRHFDVNNA